MATTSVIRSNTREIIADIQKKIGKLPGAKVEVYKQIIREAAKDAEDKYTEHNWARKTSWGSLVYKSPPGADIDKVISVKSGGRTLEYSLPMYYSKMVASRSGDTKESIQGIAKNPISDQKEVSIDLAGYAVDISFTPKVKALEMGAYNSKTGTRRRKRPYLYQALTAYQKAIKFIEKKFGEVLDT